MNELTAYDLNQDRLDLIHKHMKAVIIFREKRYGVLNGTDSTFKIQEKLLELDNWCNEQKDLTKAMAQYDWETKIK